MAANLAIRLRRKLLAIGGSDVVVLPDTYLLDLVNRGRLFEDARIRIVRGLPNECHYNAARLWLRGRCSNIATGYYLCFDGRWLQHSWGVTRGGVILDSHCGGKQYFGTILDDLRGLAFAGSVCDPPEVKRWIGTNRKRYQAMLIDALVELAESTRPRSRCYHVAQSADC